jgi:DNA-binding transcriptional ArsR family regulator
MRSIEDSVSAFGAAIGEPTRVRILFSLMDGSMRTSTELASVADVSPSTASVHLARLKKENLVAMVAHGKHHYYRLEGHTVATLLEALTAFAGEPQHKVVQKAPSRLRAARTCYDHMAGQLAVVLHDRFLSLGWLVMGSSGESAYQLTIDGVRAFAQLGIDTDAIQGLRRRFACACVDWSERRPHMGGALGAALLEVALKRKWVLQDLDCRALSITPGGRREMMARFDLAGLT